MDLRGRAIDRRVTAPSTPIRLVVGLATGLATVWISWEHLQSTWGWSASGVIAVYLALAWAVSPAATTLPPGGVPILALCAAAATYACVPETDPIRRLAVIAAIAGLVELVRRLPVAFAWAWSTVALVMWAGVHGATGRDSALVGALVAWWPLVLAAALGRSRLRPASSWGWPSVMALPVVSTLIVARTGALQPEVGPALRAAAVWPPAALALALIVAVMLRSTRRGLDVQRAG